MFMKIGSSDSDWMGHLPMSGRAYYSGVRLPDGHLAHLNIPVICDDTICSMIKMNIRWSF